jgi:hypothetical protein
MNKRWLLTLIIVLSTSFLMIPDAVTAQDAEDIGPQPAWVDLSSNQRKSVLAFAEGYKDFMSRAKTEVSFVSEAVKIVEAAGFRMLLPESEVRPGDRYYDINRDRTITLIVAGTKTFTDGFRVVGAPKLTPPRQQKGRPQY